MFTPRKTILLCLLLAFAATGSYLGAEQESDDPEMKAAESARIPVPEEDIDVPLPELSEIAGEIDVPLPGLEHFDEYLAMVPKPHDRRDWSERRTRHEERIGMFRLWRVMEKLELSDDQVDKFFPLMRQMMKRDQERAKKKRGLLKALREELEKEKPSEAELKRLMNEIKDQARLAWQERTKNLEQFNGLLTLEQRARLLLSMNQVDKDIWESIARVRMSPTDFKFDKAKLDLQMKELRNNLDSLNIRLQLKHLPGLSEFMEKIDEDEDSEEEQP